jgi:DtxR family Mn-dependent transcriptional regulator
MPDSTALTPALEDYLEAIFQLGQKHGEARVNAIAEAVAVHKSTVTAALKRLVAEGFIRHQPYGAATLTARGKSEAERISRRHRVLADFLRDVLLLDAKMAEENACRMEHVLDSKAFERLRLLAEAIRECPGNNDGCVKQLLAACAAAERAQPKEEKMTLDRLKPGESGTIVRVGNAGALKRRIVDMGVVKGTRVDVVKVAPLGDPIEIKVKGYSLSLRKGEAAAIEVDKA